MLLEYPHDLASARHIDGATAFHVLAGKPSAFAPHWGKKNRSVFISALLCINHEMQRKTPGLKLLKELCKINLKNNTVDGFLPLLRSHGETSNAVLVAASHGNDKFLGELFASCPALMKEKDKHDRNVFHIAALHLQTTVFSLVGKSMGAYYEDAILSSEDNEGNTILHSAANGVASAQYDKMKGAASRLNEHKKLFEVVREIVPPRCIEKRNRNGKTAEEIFFQKMEAVNDQLVNQKEKSWTTFGTFLGMGSNAIAICKFLRDHIFRF